MCDTPCIFDFFVVASAEMGENALHNFRNLALWILIGLLVVLLFNLFQGSSERPSAPPLSYSQFRQEIVEGDVKWVLIQNDQVHGELNNGNPFTTTIPTNDPSIWTLLGDHHVSITVAQPDDGVPTLLAVLLNWFPMLLLIAVLVFGVRRMRAGEVRAEVQVRELNWRRGLLRTWIVVSTLWLGIWTYMIWNSCRPLGRFAGSTHPEQYVCWLGPIHLPGSDLTAPLGSFTVWNWIVLIGEGLAAPAALFVLGAAILWASDGFRKAD